MKQRKLYLLIIIQILVSYPISSYAIYGGTINIKVGEEYSVSSDYGGNYVQTGSWSKSNSCIIFVSRGNKSCTIRGNRVGSSTLKYTGVSGSFDVDYTWYVNVISNGNDNNNGDTEDDSGNNVKPDTGFSDTWTSSGNYSISWFDNSKSEFYLSTANELAGVAYLVNNGYTTFEGKTIKLSQDINLYGKNWTTIGDGHNNIYKGSFDGQNHTINGIYIVKQHDEQQYYGFWAVLSEKSIIKNITLRGVVNIESDTKFTKRMGNDYKGISFIGGVVGHGEAGVYFENCSSQMDVSCKRDHSSGIYLGGFAGSCGAKKSKDIVMQNCSHIGDLYASEWSGSSCPPCIGGLIGYTAKGSSWGGILLNCENISSYIYCRQPSAADDSYWQNSDMYVGGIVGYALGSTSIQYCRSLVENLNIDQNTKASTFLYLGGISGKFGIPINSYSLIKDVDINCAQMWEQSGKVTFGGVVGDEEPSGAQANFSNSDVNVKSTYKVTEGYYGSTSYTSDQMRTGSFLEEINIYSQIYTGSPVWTPDENGLPCIAVTHPLIKKEEGININANNFPDQNFRDYLLAQDYGADGVITDDEINEITSMSIFENVSNLKGIENFVNLDDLSIDSDKLNSLDLSKNTALCQLMLWSEKLSSNVLESIINTLPLNVYTKRHSFIVGEEGALSSQLIAKVREQGWTPCYLEWTAYGPTYYKYPGEDPTGINLTESSIEINVGESFIMGYIMTPSSAVRDVTWSSDNSSVASVDNAGVIRGYNSGATYINATTNNGITGSCKVIVKEATSIQNVKMRANSNASIYNLNGQRLDKPCKGVNIIGGKKVMVK